MKVETTGLQGTTGTAKVSKIPHGETSDFKEILHDAQFKTTTEKTTSFLPPPSSAIPLINLDPAAQAEKPLDQQLASEAEYLLGILEEYQSNMDNPSVPLKQIQPLIERMENETKKLLPTLNTLPDDSALKDILNRILVASSVEIIKFNRGDYV